MSPFLTPQEIRSRLLSFKEILRKHYSSKEKLQTQLVQLKRKLEKQYSYDPLMQAILCRLSFSVDDSSETYYTSVQKALRYFQTTESHLRSVLAQKIKKGSRVYIHSCSSFLFSLLLSLSSKGVSFTLLLTSTSPDVKKALKLSGLHYTHFPDTAIPHVLFLSDIALVDAYLLHPRGLICPLGSDIVAHFSRIHHIPFYTFSCALSFDIFHFYSHYTLQTRSSKKIPSFSMLSSSLTSGSITELGILNVHHLEDEIFSHYSFLQRTK